MDTKRVPPRLPEDQPEEWSRFSVVSQRLSNLSGPQFEQLSYAVLQRRGLALSPASRLIPGGLTYSRALTPRAGPVDMALTIPGHQPILAACGVIPRSDTVGWRNKVGADLKKIREAARAAGLSDVMFVFMTTADIQPEDVLATEQALADDQVITRVEIYTLRALAHDLSVVHVDLADRFLQVPVPVRRLVLLDGGTASHRPDLPLPSQDDFASDLVYSSDRMRNCVTQALRSSGHCVLRGEPGSGKSWFAAAYARSVSAISARPAYYVDAGRCHDGDGRHWFQEVVVAHASAPLVIIDNCHAALGEVEEFCSNILADKTLTTGSHVLLVVTLGDTQGLPLGIVKTWLDAASVTLSCRETWVPVVRAYARALKERSPDRYGDIDEDFRGNFSTLESRHGHDLAASRARLDSWEIQGGHLAGVSDDTFYGYLEKKYVCVAPRLTGVLMALWSYEVSTHQRFIDSSALFAGECDALQRANIASEEMPTSPFYGRMLRPTVHRGLAAEIFRAWLRRDNPNAATSDEQIQRQLVSEFRRYLLVSPLNAQRLLGALYVDGKEWIVGQLIEDQEVYRATRSALSEGSPVDFLFFLTTAQRYIPGRVAEILAELHQPAEQKALAGRLISAVSGAGIGLAHLRRLDSSLPGQILAHIDPDTLGDRIQNGSATEVMNWLNLLSREGYPEISFSRILSKLDPGMIGVREYRGGLQSLCWLARTLDRASGSGRREGLGQKLLRKIGGVRLAAAFRRSPSLSTLEIFFQYAAHDVRVGLEEQLSVEELSDLLMGDDLKEFANAMHWYPAFKRAFELLRDTGRLKDRFAEATAVELGVFLHVCRQPHNNPAVAFEAVRLIAAGGRFERFLNEDLSALALLIFHLSRVDRESAKQLVADLGPLATWKTSVERSTLNGVQLLIYNLSQVRNVECELSAGEMALREALTTANISTAAEAATLKVFSMFVWNVFAYLTPSIEHRECARLARRLRNEIDSVPIEDLGLTLWTVVKIGEADSVFDESFCLAVRRRVTSTIESSLPHALMTIGAVEIMLPGVTGDWEVPKCDPATARALVEASVTRGVPQALVIVALAHGRGSLTITNVLPADLTRIKTVLEGEIAKALSPAVTSLVQRALNILADAI